MPSSLVHTSSSLVETGIVSLEALVHVEVVGIEEIVMDLHSSHPESVAMVLCTQLAINGELVVAGLSIPRSMGGSSEVVSQVDVIPSPLSFLPLLWVGTYLPLIWC